MASMPVSKTAHAGSNPASPAPEKSPENPEFSGLFAFKKTILEVS